MRKCLGENWCMSSTFPGAIQNVTGAGSLFREEEEAYSRSLYRASKRLCILRKSGRVFHNQCFRGFVLLVMDYCGTVWCSGADTHRRLMNLVVITASLIISWRCVWWQPLLSSFRRSFVYVVYDHSPVAWGLLLLWLGGSEFSQRLPLYVS